MNNKNVLFFILSLLLLTAFTSCVNEKEHFQEKIKNQILLYEKDNLQIDSLTILEIDSLTRYGYVKVMLEQLENMEFDFNNTLNTNLDLSDSELTELKIMVNEVRNLIRFYKEKTEDNTDNETFFCYFVQVQMWSLNQFQTYYYLLSHDFKILDDPFEETIE